MTWKRDEFGREYDNSQSANQYVFYGVGWGMLIGVLLCLVIGLLIPW